MQDNGETSALLGPGDGQLGRALGGHRQRDRDVTTFRADRPVGEAGGRGDVSKTHVVWKENKQVPEVPSPLYHQGRLYLVREAATDEGSPREPSPFWDEVQAVFAKDDVARWTRRRPLQLPGLRFGRELHLHGAGAE